MKFPFQTVALIGKHKSPDVAAPLLQLAGFLSGRGLRIVIDAISAEHLAGNVYPALPLDEIARSVDLAIVIGGDGTMLNIARALAPHHVPLVGVNQGRVGFLTDLTLDNLHESIGAILDGQFVTEQRLLLCGRVLRDGVEVFSGSALNEVVVHRNSISSMVEFEVRIDGEYLYNQRADNLDFIGTFDKPSRNYDALQVTATQRPTKRSLLLASYTYSVQKGNYAGLFSTETNQLDPNITSLYDLPDLMANRYGNSGLDRPHNLKLDGFYQFDLARAGVLTVGASFRAQSGIAHNALAAHPIYGVDESYVLPRGAIARSPVTTNTDLQFSYGRRLSKATMLEGFVRVFNLFDQQDELNVDESYTFDNAQPIVGGDRKDLGHLKTIDPVTGLESNVTAEPNKNFDRAGLLSAPRSVQLGFRLTF